MIVEFDHSFLKSLSKINDSSLFQKIKRKIIELEDAKDIKSVRNVKKLTGYKTYFRVRIGEFRIGFESVNKGTIRLISIAHRKDIYRIFP